MVKYSKPSQKRQKTLELLMGKIFLFLGWDDSIKMSAAHKTTYQSNTTPVTTATSFFSGASLLEIKVHMEKQTYKNSKGNTEKEKP